MGIGTKTAQLIIGSGNLMQIFSNAALHFHITLVGNSLKTAQ